MIGQLMAKTATASDLHAILQAAQVTAPALAPVNKVEVPEYITEQVAKLAERKGLYLSVPVTDEALFTELRELYINAAMNIGRSANVTKTHKVTKDDEGNEIRREWISTRVSVSDKRGRKPSSATNGNTPDAGTDSTETTTSGQTDQASW